jgi:hypothetical protein
MPSSNGINALKGKYDDAVHDQILSHNGYQATFG